jgi:hypothetical protein
MPERDLRQWLLEDRFTNGTDSELKLFDVGIGWNPAGIDVKRGEKSAL